jgi:hypothetical protein
MAKQSINVGATANDKKGDSLRAAFQKVNNNFTELYTALGLAADTTLNLGAFEFDGSVMTTTDSTPIVIDQATTVTSDLTVGGDIVPSVANGGNLGSLEKPFKSLYVSTNTVFLGGVPLSLDAGTNELTINNVPISQTITYADIPNSPTVPTDISDLTDTGGLLGSFETKFKPLAIVDGRLEGELFYNTDAELVSANDLVIDQSTWVWANTQLGQGTFIPSVYTATVDGNGRVTDIAIIESNYYDDREDYVTINTDNLYVLPAGTLLTAESIAASGGPIAVLAAGVSSSSVSVPIPLDISDLTDTEGLLGGSPTNVKLESPDDRRIEEVYGYNEVSVTEPGTVNLTTTASRDSDGIARIWIDTTTTTIDEILDDTDAAGITDTATIEFSVDNTTWYTQGGTWFDGDERGYGVNIGGDTLTYSQGDTVYFRYVGGGAPVVWWDKNELPGGSSDFRGAVINYHAYTGESTIIGTIHIVDDDGEDHITHTEVQSGSTDGENDDLWVVTSEGQIKYRRIDGESKTLKIQWAAKVFYGSEAYD